MTLPNLDPPFRRARGRADDPGVRESLDALETRFVVILQEELTKAFPASFEAAAYLALGALPFVGAAWALRLRRRRGLAPP
jgi:hypothetical protein